MRQVWFEGRYYRKKAERSGVSGYRPIRRVLKIERIDGKMTTDSKVTYRDLSGVWTCSLSTMRASFEPVWTKSET